MPKRDNPGQQPDELTRRWNNIENNVAHVEVTLNKLQACPSLQQFIQELTKLLKTVKQIKSDADTCHKLSSQTTKRQKLNPVEQSRPPHQKFVATGVAGIPVGRGQGVNQPINLTGIQGGIPGQKAHATTFLPPQHIRQKFLELQNTANPNFQAAQGVPVSRPLGGPIHLSPQPPNPLQRPLQQPPNFIFAQPQQSADCQQMRVVRSTPTRPPSVPSQRGGHYPYPHPYPQPQQMLRVVPQSLPTALGLLGQQRQQQFSNLTLQQQLASMAPSSHQPTLPQRSKDQGGGPVMAPPSVLKSVPVGAQEKIQQQQTLELPKQTQINIPYVQNAQNIKNAPQSVQQQVNDVQQ